MAEYKDRVKDQTNTTGTGTVTIDGVAANGYRTIASAHTTGATVRYTIVNSSGSQWEVGEGVWTAATNTMTRATVYASSNSGSLVNFSAGAKAVFTGPVAQDLTEALPTTGGTMTGRLKLDTAGSSTTFFVNSGTSFGFVTHVVSNTTTTFAGDNGLTSSALFGNLSQPIISNSGAGGSNGNVVYGASFIPQIASSGASALIGAYGVQSFAERSNAADVSTNSGNALHGGFFTARHTTALANATLSGTIAALTGSTLVQGGTATNAYGVFSTGNVGSSNVANNTVAVTNFYQFFGNAINVGSAANSYGTITNYYGLYLSSPTVNARGTITNRWGVYQADASGDNYFAGRVLLGSTTDNGTDFLQVTGSMSLSSALRVGATPSAGTSGNFLKSGGAGAAPSWGALSSSEVTTALGFTPYNSTNPSGYITSSGSITGNAATSTRTTDGANGLRLLNPGGASYVTSTATVTGAFKIKFPTAANNSSTMLRFTVKIYEYSTGMSRTLEIGGYNYSASWYNWFATQDSQSGGDLTVRFGSDATGDCVWIGETTSTWQYPQVFITDFQAGYSNYTDPMWGTGWSVSVVTAFDTVDSSTTAYRTIHSGNFNSYSPTLTGTGASGTWGISITGNAATVSSITSSQVTTALGYTPYNSTNPNGYITSSSLSSYLALSGGTMTGQITTKTTTGTTPIVNGGSSDSLQIMGSTTAGAFVSFHRAGAYAINMGMDTSNVFAVGGWSDGAAYRWQVDASGNFTARGNVTAYSDERLKKDWSDLPADFIEQLAKVKRGTYTRIDSGERQVGISAQGLLAVLQEAVSKDGQGNLSVAYGNAALAAAVALAAKVVSLEARLAALEA